MKDLCELPGVGSSRMAARLPRGLKGFASGIDLADRIKRAPGIESGGLGGTGGDHGRSWESYMPPALSGFREILRLKPGFMGS